MKVSAAALLVAASVLASASASQAALVAYWNFNDFLVSTAGPPGTNDVPTAIGVTVAGSGTINLANWKGNVDDYIGTSVNAIGPDGDGRSLGLVGLAGNNSSVDFEFATTGLEDVVLTFAHRGSQGSYNNSTWSYSTDGQTFELLPGVSTVTRATAFALATVDFSSITAIDDAPSVTLRYTLSGASNNSGQYQMDNIQVNATSAVTAIPEPAALGLVPAAGLLLARRRRS